MTHATKITLLNANYILSRLSPHYPILYTNSASRCAHEFILDVRKFKETAGVEANTLMIEPTESEDKDEIDRFCDALIEIRKEIREVEHGRQPRQGNVLKMAPHPAADLMREDWARSYNREQAAYPLPYLREKKFWPTVTRLDDGESVAPFGVFADPLQHTET